MTAHVAYRIPNAGSTAADHLANPGPFTRVTQRFRRALRAAGLGHALTLLDELATAAEGGACWLSQAALAERMGTTVRTVKRQERALTDAGILRRIHGGPGNRRLVVLEHLDAQDVPARPTAAADAPPRTWPASARAAALETLREAARLLHTLSPASPHSPGSGDTDVTSTPPQGVGTCADRMIRIARDAGARVEKPLSDSSARQAPGTAAAPWSAWRGGSNATLQAAGRGTRMPDWAGPSQAVDERLQQLHTRLGIFDNCLRQAAIWARDICTARGEERTLKYLDALERHCARARRPGAMAYGALRRRTAQRDAKPALRQHVLEELMGARPLAALVREAIQEGPRRAARR